jgi:hypothetical protein
VRRKGRPATAPRARPKASARAAAAAITNAGPRHGESLGPDKRVLRWPRSHLGPSGSREIPPIVTGHLDPTTFISSYADVGTVVGHSAEGPPYRPASAAPAPVRRHGGEGPAAARAGVWGRPATTRAVLSGAVAVAEHGVRASTAPVVVRQTAGAPQRKGPKRFAAPPPEVMKKPRPPAQHPCPAAWRRTVRCPCLGAVLC